MFNIVGLIVVSFIVMWLLAIPACIAMDYIDFDEKDKNGTEQNRDRSNLKN